MKKILFTMMILFGIPAFSSNSYETDLVGRMKVLEEKAPTTFAVKQYKKYKLAAGKTAKSILISWGARLVPFGIEELRNLMSKDELELDALRR